MLAYDGTDFFGWQRQASGRTIQAELEGMLARLNGDRPIAVVAAGRTDSGVHAAGQIAHADYHAGMDDAEVRHALRRMSAPDLAVLDVATVPSSFHARYNARRRSYTYRILRRPDPFAARFALHLDWPLRTDLLIEAATKLLGQHDFTALSKHNPDTPNPVCTVYEAGWTEGPEGELRFTVKADRFLYGMVRLLVGLQLDVARGRRPLDTIDEIFRSVDRSFQSPAVSAQGLTLVSVEYADAPPWTGNPTLEHTVNRGEPI
jgi:tRNA pseudouridine38-40 synthase